jgi:hypothetical protein
MALSSAFAAAALVAADRCSGRCFKPIEGVCGSVSLQAGRFGEGLALVAAARPLLRIRRDDVERPDLRGRSDDTLVETEAERKIRRIGRRRHPEGPALKAPPGRLRDSVAECRTLC